jgi:anaerobic selenocysteine-containing dehydrogenase
MKSDKVRVRPYKGPAGGWGSAKAVGSALGEGALVHGGMGLLHQTKPRGSACVSCAWAKSAHSRPLEFCENGARATAWEVTSFRAKPDFFKAHTVTELLDWSDHALEQQGRLTHPLRWDAHGQVSAGGLGGGLREIGPELRALDPKGRSFMRPAVLR